MRYTVIYAKLTHDIHAEPPVALLNDSVFLGGGDVATLEEAEEMAREIVRAVAPSRRAFTIPRVFLFDPEEEKLIDVVYRAAEYFEKMVQDFNETIEITKQR